MVQLKDYVKFTSDDPALSFSFLYPESWQVREIKGVDYNEVFIRGPANQEGTYHVAVVVRSSSIRSWDGRYASLEEAVEDYLTKHQRTANFREISRSYGSLADADATEIEVSYTIPLPINAVNPQQTPIMERRIFLLRGDYFYEIVFRGGEEDYYRYLDVLKDIVRTFEFHDNGTQRLYRPLVTPAPARAVSERSSGT